MPSVAYKDASTGQGYISIPPYEDMAEILRMAMMSDDYFDFYLRNDVDFKRIKELVLDIIETYIKEKLYLR